VTIGTRTLKDLDPLVHGAISDDAVRQRRQIEFLAPKNYMSRAVREAYGSMISFTTVEGYPGRRYHAGTQNIDSIERAAIDRACRAFGAEYANVQPHSGTQANLAVMFGLLEPGDHVVSMDLKAGGHLSHGLASNMSGRWFDVDHYGVSDKDGWLDYEQAAQVCAKHRPKLIIVGGSSYPRAIDFPRFRAIADKCGAILLADVAHFAGLIVGGAYPSPFPWCDIVTTTTNKNLRGPRGGLILAADRSLAKILDSAIFPGTQGGPLPEVVAAKAVAFSEMLLPTFATYAHSVLANARHMCRVFADRGFKVVTQGTDTPLIVLDLTATGISGSLAQDALERAGLPCNKNLVPGDTKPPSETSGLRLGTSAATTRGLGIHQIDQIAHLMADLLNALDQGDNGADDLVKQAEAEVRQLAAAFPIPGA